MRRWTERTGVPAVAVLAALALAGCEDAQVAYPGAPPPPPGAPYYRPVPPAAPTQQGFSPQEFAWSQGVGPASVVGRVAYHSVAGEHWTCSGQTIALIPATRYSAVRMFELYGSQDQAVVPAATVRTRNAERPGVDYGRFVRTASCDARDAFSFAGVQPGPYFLIARARPKGHAAGPNEGVVIMQRVDLAPGPTRIVVPRS